MKARLGSDEFVLYYLSPEDDRFGGSQIIELTPEDFLEYKRIEAAHEGWQKRLHQMAEKK